MQQQCHLKGGLYACLQHQWCGCSAKITFCVINDAENSADYSLQCTAVLHIWDGFCVGAYSFTAAYKRLDSFEMLCALMAELFWAGEIDVCSTGCFKDISIDIVICAEFKPFNTKRHCVLCWHTVGLRQYEFMHIVGHSLFVGHIVCLAQSCRPGTAT